MTLLALMVYKKNNIEPLLLLSKNYGELGDFNLAIAYLLKGLKIAPSNYDLNFNLAYNYWRLKENDNAVFLL